MLLKEVLYQRDNLYKIIRTELQLLNCIEVNTPIICPYPDIAPVKQFQTSHPSKPIEGTLRIAPTEFLKRLLVLGMERIYEFSINFRDEEFSKQHLCEFVSLEVMMKESDVFDMMNLTERLCKLAANLGKADVFNSALDGKNTVLKSNDWPRVSLPKFLLEEYSFEINSLFKPEKVVELYHQILPEGIANTSVSIIEDIINSISYKYSTPVFVYDFPYYIGGPAEPSKFDNRFKERAELYYSGIELANMSSTLTNVESLRKWHLENIEEKVKINIIPNLLDEPLFIDLAHGLDKSAVVGIGIDRLLMLILNIDDISDTKAFSFNQLFSNFNYEKDN